MIDSEAVLGMSPSEPLSHDEEVDAMTRVRVRWILMLALVGVVGCSGADGSAEAEESSAGQMVARSDSTPSQSAAFPHLMAPAELFGRLEGEDAPILLDVRSAEEYEAGHIPGAINVPYDQIAASLDSLESFRTGEIVVYCRTGRRAGVAEDVLREAGFTRVFDLEGHMVSWNEQDLPVAVPAACC